MRTGWACAAAMTIGSAAAWWFLSAPGDAQERPAGPPKPDRVGFVDVEEIFDKYKKKADIENELAKEGQEVQGKLRSIEEQVRDLKKQAENSTDWKAQEPTLKKMFERTAEAQALRDLTEMKLGLRQQELAKTLREEIDAEIRAYSAAEGYTLVVSQYTTAVIPGQQGSRPQTIRRPIVVYSEARHDLTQAVLVRLNKKYEARRQLEK